MLKDDDGGRPRPDVIVHLPEGRDLIIDAKVSLTAYERYCAAAGDHERGTQLSAHLASLRVSRQGTGRAAATATFRA